MVFTSTPHTKYKINTFIDLLQLHPRTIPEIVKEIGISYRRAFDIMNMLMESGVVDRKNRTSDSKPTYEYYLTRVYNEVSDDKIKIESTKLKVKKLSELGMKF